MFSVPAPPAFYHLVDRAGNRTPIKNLQSLLKTYSRYWLLTSVGLSFDAHAEAVRRYRSFMGPTAVPSRPIYELNFYAPPVLYVLRDLYDNLVDVAALLSSAQALRYAPVLSPRYTKRYRQNIPYGQPVPFTGKSRRSFKNSMRYPKTHQAQRQGHWLAQEGEPPVRAKRRAHNLKTAWDDQLRSTCGNKNWKRFRKHQYKSNKV